MEKELRKDRQADRGERLPAIVPGGKHFKVKDAEGNTLYTIPGTPSGQLWRVRLLSELRKRGIIE